MQSPTSSLTVIFQVHKEECINHVRKRLGTQLQKLREKSKVTTIHRKKRSTLGGRNKPTDKVLEKLPFYYGQAVWRNTGNNVEELKNDIIATFYHCTSTDKNPWHDHCPPGEKSWCFYRKAEAKGEIPASHKAMKVSPCLILLRETSASSVHGPNQR